MSAILWSDVTAIAPELAGRTADAAQLVILAVANSVLDVFNWGGENSAVLKLARCYLAAHHATLARRRGIGGAVTAESAGEIRRSYAVMTSASFMATTSYGQLYLTLARTRPFRVGLVPGGGQGAGGSGVLGGGGSGFGSGGGWGGGFGGGCW